MFEYNNIKVNYKYKNNNSDKTLVLLHGWGQNIEMMEPLSKPFEKNCNTLIIDLPGHGKSMEPKSVWDLDDFVEMIHSLIIKLKITNPIVIGHSFGGKLSIIYASKYEVSKLVLLASPYKVKIKKLSLKVRILKFLAKLPFLRKIAEKMKKKIGSTDYRNASEIMRKIMVKHVNTDVTELCKKISCPTIMIWGTADKDVSIEDAYELEKLIKDSAVIPYEGYGHFAYYENIGQTVNIVKSFIGE